jgi:hypothetical protein
MALLAMFSKVLLKPAHHVPPYKRQDDCKVWRRKSDACCTVWYSLYTVPTALESESTGTPGLASLPLPLCLSMML